MTSINSDSAFKSALAELSVAQQRRVGKRFVDNVISLTDNPRVGKLLQVADDSDASEQDINQAYNTARAVAIDSYTLCGRDADWIKQASHFVAAAAAACLAPSEQTDAGSGPGLGSAMNARMARVCERIAAGEHGDDSEARAQYAILSDFISES